MASIIGYSCAGVREGRYRRRARTATEKATASRRIDSSAYRICSAPMISGTNSAVRNALRPMATLAQQPVYSDSLKARAVAMP